MSGYKIKLNKAKFLFNLLLYINLVIFDSILIISLTPYLTRQLSTINYVILISVWFFTIFLVKPLFMLKPTKLTLLTFFWIAYLIVTRLLGIGDYAIGNLFYYISFWFMIVALEFFNSLNNPAIEKKILNTIYVIMPVNIIINIIELNNNPTLSKYISGGVISGANSNVGTYSFAFICGLVGFVFLWRSSQMRLSKLHKLYLILLFILSFYMVYLSASMISILSAIIMMSIYIYLHVTRNNLFNKSVFILFSTCILFVVLLFQQDIYKSLYNLLNNISNIYTQTRAIAVLNTLLGYRDELSLSGRVPLYLDSIATFISNPLFGIGMHHTNVSGIISRHSQILDDMAYFGIFGIVVQVSIMVQYCKKYLRPITANYSELIYPYYIAIIFFSLFNPVITSTLSAGIIFFCFVPFILNINRAYLRKD